MGDISEKTLTLLKSFWWVIFPIIIVCALVYWLFIRRYNTETRVPVGASITVRVARVGDGDGFKALHVPLFRSSNIFKKNGSVRKDIPLLSFRLAGVDAPEVRAFGKPEQPYAQQAKEFLSYFVLYKKVNVKVLHHDQYGRLVVMASTGSMFWKKNINLQMVENGLACVYEGSNAVYGGLKHTMLEAETQAKKLKLGMWKSQSTVTPMAYKKLHK